MPLPYEAAVEAVRSGRPAPAYILAGPDGFQQAAVLEALAERVPDLGRQRLDGGAVEPREVVGALRSVSLVPGRLVVVEDAPWIIPPRRGEGEPEKAPTRGRAAPEQPLLDYLDRPLAGAVLVLRAAVPPDRRRRLVKRIAEAGVLLEAIPPRDNGPWLRQRSRALGLRLSPGTLAVVAGRLHGADCGRMDAELRKLLAYGEEPDGAALDALLPPAAEERIYDLVDAALAGRAATAQAVAEGLLVQGEPVPRLLYSLALQLRTLLQVREACRGGVRPEEAAAGLGLHPFIARKAWDQVRQLNDEAIARSLQAVWEAELGYKSGQLADAAALDRALLGVLLAVRPTQAGPAAAAAEPVRR